MTQMEIPVNFLCGEQRNSKGNENCSRRNEQEIKISDGGTKFLDHMDYKQAFLHVSKENFKYRFSLSPIQRHEGRPKMEKSPTGQKTHYVENLFGDMFAWF